MLKKILSVSGKSGLFRLVAQGKNMYIAESLLDGKRIPVHVRDKVVSLGDIAIYTEEEEVPLAVVLNNIKSKESGVVIDLKSYSQPADLKAYFEKVLPSYDRDKVYPSDMKKIMNWYNILLNAGISDFDKKEEEAVDSMENTVVSEVSEKE